MSKSVKKVVKTSKKVLKSEQQCELFTTMKNVLIKGKQQNSFRFESQEHRIWSFQELHQHSHAVALGLIELGYRTGDKMGLMVERSYPAEVVAMQLGCWKAGVEVVNITPMDTQHLATLLNQHNIKGLLFSPNSQTVGSQQKYSQIVQQVVGTQGMTRGTALNMSTYPHLQHLIHTGFHSIDGCFKMRQMMVYGMKGSVCWNQLEAVEQSEQNRLDGMNGKQLLEQSRQMMQRLGITKDRTVVLAGENRSQLATTVGLLHALTNGQQVVATGNLPFNQLSAVLQWYSNPLLLLEDQVIIHSQQLHTFNQHNLKDVQVVVHSYDQHSKQKLDEQFDINKIFEGFKVENMMSTLI